METTFLKTIILTGITLYDQLVLKTFSNLKKESPGVSARAFIACLQSISAEHGKVPFVTQCLD